MFAFFKKNDSFYQNEHELVNLIPFILALVTGNQGTDHPLSLPQGKTPRYIFLGKEKGTLKSMCLKKGVCM